MAVRKVHYCHTRIQECCPRGNSKSIRLTVMPCDMAMVRDYSASAVIVILLTF